MNVFGITCFSQQAGYDPASLISVEGLQSPMKKLFLLVSLLVVVMLPVCAFGADSFRVPILLYHRLGPTVADGMTITTPVFESHMKYLHDNGYTVISPPSSDRPLSGEGPGSGAEIGSHRGRRCPQVSV